jgi:Ca-activated chloride channel family protein
MASDPDPILPTAPAPSPASRDRALAAALARFDAAQDPASQGIADPARPRQRGASERRASWKAPLMIRTRYAVAATAIVAIAGPLAWNLAQEREGQRRADPPGPAQSRQDAPAPSALAPEPQQSAPEQVAAAPASPAVPPPPNREHRFDAGSGVAPPKLPSPRAQAPAAAPRSLVREREAQSFHGAASELAPAEPLGRDRFDQPPENGFKVVREAPVSTFSIDVDTASYSFVRASLNRNVLPPKAAVRTEELINYFPYAYAGPASAAEPFAVTSAVYPSPWVEGRKIVQVGIKGYAVTAATRPAANLVFLVDTSGSMNGPNRLPLVKQSLAMLLTQLDGRDRVAIVAYAGGAGTVLEPTPADQKAKILGAIEGLGAGGGTAGGEGIRQAYALAERGLDPSAVNRVVLATDGDFNVGITDRDALKGFVERERAKGIFLSVLGFGMGNYGDALMQALAQNGNGAAAYIDTLSEARKVLVEEATSALIPIAKDVKIQVEFNPAAVAEYRLIGYETRLLARQDFANDKVDAGEVGSGQAVTALYEIVPVGGPRLTGDLRYAAPAPETGKAAGEYAHVAIRYKLPKSDTSTLMTTPIDRSRESARFEDAPGEARFATAVAGFAEILRGGTYTGGLGYEDVVRIASGAKGDDPFGYRAEFVQLVRAAKTAQALTAPR